MPTYFEKHIYNVAGAYLPAIINGDYSGLEYGDDAEADTALVERFLAGFPDRTVFDCGDEPEITECDISGLLAECYMLTAYAPNADYTQAIADYCDRTDADFGAVCAFVDCFGLGYLDDGNYSFEDSYAGTFATQSDIDDYLVDQFIDCSAPIPDHIAGYLDHAAIASDMRYDYTIEGSGPYYLFRNY